MKGLGQAGRTAVGAECVGGHPMDGGDTERADDVPYHRESGRELGVRPEDQSRCGEFLGAVAEDAHEVRGRVGQQGTQRLAVVAGRPVHVLDDEQDRPLAGQRLTGARSACGVGHGRPKPLHQAALAAAGSTLDQEQYGAARPFRVEGGAEPPSQRRLGFLHCS